MRSSTLFPYASRVLVQFFCLNCPVCAVLLERIDSQFVRSPEQISLAQIGMFCVRYEIEDEVLASPPKVCQLAVANSPCARSPRADLKDQKCWNLLQLPQCLRFADIDPFSKKSEERR